MRLIKPSTLKLWARRHGDAAEALAAWQALVEGNDFPHFVALRRVFPHADQVETESGRTATVFNVKGNRYRLIAALHYNRGICYALRFLTHAEYDKGAWKNEL